jgi:hypothetical protein
MEVPLQSITDMKILSISTKIMLIFGKPERVGLAVDVGAFGYQ